MAPIKKRKEDAAGDSCHHSFTKIPILVSSMALAMSYGGIINVGSQYVCERFDFQDGGASR